MLNIIVRLRSPIGYNSKSLELLIVLTPCSEESPPKSMDACWPRSYLSQGWHNLLRWDYLKRRRLISRNRKGPRPAYADINGDTLFNSTLNTNCSLLLLSSVFNRTMLKTIYSH